MHRWELAMGEGSSCWGQVESALWPDLPSLCLGRRAPCQYEGSNLGPVCPQCCPSALHSIMKNHDLSFYSRNFCILKVRKTFSSTCGGYASCVDNTRCPGLLM